MNYFQQRIIERAERHEDKLNSWEIDFIDSISNLPVVQELTKKQNHCLNKISEKLY